jgi:hypothetical protein
MVSAPSQGPAGGSAGVKQIIDSLQYRSIAFVTKLDGNIRQLMLWWTILASFICGLRLGAGTSLAAPDSSAHLVGFLSYALLVAAPVASLMLALHWFRDADRMAQPSTRLAVFGAWRSVSAAGARALPLYGATGLMASLLLGMLINIPVRMLEFVTAIPALSGSHPAWFGSLYGLMFADAVLFSSLYAIAFVAALRHVPLFPRLLGTIWAADIAMQLVIAHGMAATDGLPRGVALPLEALLEGNIKKVLVSMALWAPYLLLSKRVNLTYRHRIPA